MGAGQNRKHQFKLTAFARLDAVDSERTHFDVREAYWRGVFGNWEVLIGANKVFWGVTESRHLVDVINQTDLLEDIDNEDKLGQPMAMVSWQRPWGRLTGYALFGFRERPFPGIDGRLRVGIPIDRDSPFFADGKRDVDLALRYSHYLGPFDVAASVFHGTGREPAFFVTPLGGPLRPLYETITQGSVELQYTREAWLWKLEALVRGGEGSTFAAAVGGFEYTLFQVFSTAGDVGLLGEYLYDGRDETAPPTLFDNDIFLGSRLTLNDTQNTQILAGAIIDLDDGATAARIEGERRLTDYMKIEVEGRFFVNIEPFSAFGFIRNDSLLTLRVSTSF